jgi:competence protein ComEA
MFRGAEPEGGVPHPLGAKGRVAALAGIGPGGLGVAPETRHGHDADLRPGAADSIWPPLPADGVDAAADAAEAERAGWVPDRRVPGSGRGRAWAARLTTAGPWGELAEKWVPEPLRGARIDPKRRGALVLSAVAAVAAIAAALGVWWSRPQPIPVPAAATSSVSVAAASLGAPSDTGRAEGGTPTAGAAAATGEPRASAERSDPTPVSGSPAPTGTIVVSVTGNVRSPGVVSVPADARVADAIAAAGGALDDSDLPGLNRAARLVDGSSVVVAGSGGSTVTVETADAGADEVGSGSTAGAKVNLNTADATALQTLSGVGPVTAAAIVAYRTEHGPFTDLAQLQEVSGIGPATFARLQPHVTL